VISPEPLPHLLLIGQFARLSGLSCRMLRFYAEQHILVPAYTDPETGYRRYLSSQLGEARFLLRLRRADFSVEDIRSILQGLENEKLQFLGKEQRQGLGRKIRALEECLRELDSLEKEWEAPRYGLFRMEPLPVCSAPFRGERKTLRELARRTAENLFSAFPEALPQMPFLCVYSIEKGPKEAILHVPGEGNCPDLLPGGLMATALHRGSYETLPETLKGLLGWVRHQGLTPRGTVRERYFPGGDDRISPQEVELSLPLMERES